MEILLVIQIGQKEQVGLLVVVLLIVTVQVVLIIYLKVVF